MNPIEEYVDRLSDEADRILKKYVKGSEDALVAAAVMIGVLYSAAGDLYLAAWKPGNEDACKILRDLAREFLNEARIVKNEAGIE